MEAKESLRIIDEMISKAKADISDNGIFYLLWGWLILLACLSQYVLLYVIEWEYHWIGWPVLTIAGGIGSSVIGARLSRKAKVKTHFDRIMMYVWGGFGITLFLVLSSMGQAGPQAIYPIVIATYALGTFISGGILKFRPLIIGAVISWVIAFILLFAEFQYQLLGMSASIIAAYLVPGYILRKKYRER